jgi:hypothetical protein
MLADTGTLRDGGGGGEGGLGGGVRETQYQGIRTMPGFSISGLCVWMTGTAKQVELRMWDTTKMTIHLTTQRYIYGFM